LRYWAESFAYCEYASDPGGNTYVAVWRQ
jgi:hypothetical protein